MAPLKKGDIAELKIEAMAYGGKGIARADGFVVFVRGGVTGDRIRARIYRKKRNYAEAELTELMSTNPSARAIPLPP